MLGKSHGAMALRLYVTGSVGIENGTLVMGERSFPGNQGRLVFAMLACERRRPVARDELADWLWGEELPEAWAAGLSAIVSKLRALFAKAGLPRDGAIDQTFGAYRLQLPPDAWIDVEAAEIHLELAEAAKNRGAPMDGYGDALTTYMICRRPILAGEENAWLERKRRELAVLLVRALDCLVDVYAGGEKRALAIKFAEEALDIDPYNEWFYRKLIALHASDGNRGAAARAFTRCKKLLADDLGIAPSEATEAAYAAALHEKGTPL